MIAIRGYDATISRELIKLLPSFEVALDVERGEPPPLHAERYLFAQGLLSAKPVDEMTSEEVEESLNVNAYDVMNACDRIIDGNANARICVIGSESAYSGSFDKVYANAKMILHRYVEHKKLRTEHQQLFGIAPTIISDSAMTERRRDQEALALRAQKHPKRRWLTAREVAKFIHYCLFVDQGYLSGVVIRLNGGSHTQGTTT
jgi:NAD(P)-dependent dehydrogenase (short-subunit alcohol dehydrogenase family)